MLITMVNGFVFNIQKYSLHDGPGIRTTVFLKGCPLHCWWCHNPEGMSPDPEILVAEGRCTACGQCREACPQGGARPAGRDAVAQAAPPACVRCGACVEACPTQARQLLGRRMTAAEVVAEIEKDHIFYDDSQGGVTCSGGEPFAQTPFLLELLQACRQREIHTAVDTTGFAGQDALLAVGPLDEPFPLRHQDPRRRPASPVHGRLQRLDPGEPETPRPASTAISGFACRSCRA